MRRGLTVALALCLAGAVLLLVGSGRTWTTVLVQGVAPLPDTSVQVPGSDLVPGLRGLGLLGLAGVPALLAVRRTGRVLVGLLLAGAGAVAVGLTVRVLADLPRLVGRTDAWQQARGGGPLSAADPGPAAAEPGIGPYVCLLAGLLLLAAGLLTAARGRRWPALGARYEAPRASAAPRPAGGAGSAEEPGPASAPTPTAPPRPTAAPRPAGAPGSDKAVWDALDRGEDPTR